MKKRLFARATALVMSLSLLSTSAFAHVVTIDGVEGTQDVETVQSGVDMIAGSESKAGSIQLTEDANEKVTITGADVTIDLNGNDLGTGSGAAITVKDKADVTLTDDSDAGDGSITGGYNAVNVSGSNSTVEIDGINIAGGVNMLGSNNEITVNDSTITYTSSEAISISGKNDSLKISNSTISTAAQWGVVKLTGEGASLDMSNSNITNGDSRGYGIYANNVSQDIQISGSNIQAVTGIGFGVNAADTDVDISASSIFGRDCGIDLKTDGVSLTVDSSVIDGGIKTSDGSVIRKASDAEDVENVTIHGEIAAAVPQPGETVEIIPNLFPVVSNIGASAPQSGWLETAGDQARVSTPEGYSYKAVYVKVNANINADELATLMENIKVTYTFTVEGVTYTSNQTVWVPDWVSGAGSVTPGCFGIGIFVSNDPSETTDVTINIENVAVDDYDVLSSGKYAHATYHDGTGNAFPGFESNGAITSDNNCVEGIELSLTKNQDDSGNLYLTYHNHTPVTDAAVPATCTETGLTEGSHCSVCGEVLVEQTVIAATGHTSGEAVRENEIDAQIGVAGSYDLVTYCTVCGDELSRVPMTIPALPEPTTPDEGDTTEPTDPDDGDTTEPTDPDDGDTTEPTTPDVGGDDVIITDPDVPMVGAPDADDAEALTIEDEEVPLAGIVTLAELLENLREHEEIDSIELPEDFKFIDHDYAQAIYWALAEGLVVDTEEDPLDPDEIVTVGLLQKVLDNFVETYKELEDFDVTVEGEADEMVLDLGERLAAFYAELELELAKAK